MALNVKWRGAVSDYSGYGCANRDYIRALHDQGVGISIDPWNYEARPPEFYGENGLLVKKLQKQNLDYNINVCHLVPNNVRPYYEIGKKNIGINTWETDRLPPHWVEQINFFFDLQLVPSEYNKRVYENSGVTIPVKVLPHCFDTRAYKNAEPMVIKGIEDKFKFLSVFQWTERKNPVGLLKAYFTEFYDCQDVILILKVYGLNHSEQERNRLKSIIEAVKSELQLDPVKCPQILFIGTMLEDDVMKSLYKTCDCFVLPSRSEGFGMPYAEACAAGLPVVAPNYSGQVDFLRSPYAYLCDYQLTPVAHMQFPHYSGLGNWCEPDISDFKYGMHHFYEMKKEKPELFEKISKQAQEAVEVKLSYAVIGKQFKEILEQI